MSYSCKHHGVFQRQASHRIFEPSRVQINCTHCYRPNIVVNTHSDSESDSDSEYDPRDSESDSDVSFVSEDESDTETEASVSEDEGSESESESDVDIREVKPYHGQGFRVYFDSVKDRRHFMRAFGFN
jgi:hypothetical protein